MFFQYKIWLFIKPGIQERGTECGECGERGDCYLLLLLLLVIILLFIFLLVIYLMLTNK